MCRYSTCNNNAEPEGFDCDSYSQHHQLDAIPAHGSLALIGQVDAKERVASLHNFPQIQQKDILWCIFLSHKSKLCVHSIPSYTWLWFGLAKVVINYTDIVLAKSARGC